MQKIKTFILAVATLTGTIIGVGFFSLPYITLQVGVWVMLAYFLALGSISILLHVIFGKVALKTPDFLRFPGYVKTHLGESAGKLALATTISGLFGSILAYLIVGGNFLSALLSPIFGGGEIIYVLLYFFTGAFLIFFGIKIISKIELWGVIMFFIILIVFFIKGFSQIKLVNLFPAVDHLSMGLGHFFLPYGAILFSLSGAGLIPEVEEMLGGRKNLLKKVIIASLLISILVYLSFVFLILGISGASTAQSSLTGLRDFLGKGMFSLGLFLGILTTFTSFIALGLNLKNVFHYDLKVGKNLAWLITCFVPLILFLAGIKNFISVISFVGGVMLGIDGILILLMYGKISKKKFLIYPLSLVLLGGIIYEIIYFLR